MDGKKVVSWRPQLGEVPLGGNDPVNGFVVTWDDGSEGWLSEADFNEIPAEDFIEPEEDEEEDE